MTFATEETVFANVEVLSSMMHAAILQAVAAAGRFQLRRRGQRPDFLAWQRGNSPNPLSAGDLAVWQANYSQSLASAMVVPEPNTSMMLLMTLALANHLGRARRCR